jgi:hypothetical protein
VTPLDEAKELLGLVTTPSALVTGTFLAFAGRAISDNRVKVDHVKMAFALGAALAASAVAIALAVLMAPIAVEHGWSFRGDIEPVLVVYSMITLSVVGTAVYSAWMVYRCVGQLRRPGA